jgi:hypothetical protein
VTDSGLHPSQVWFYENVVLPISRGERHVVNFLDGLGPDVGSNLRDAGLVAAQMNPSQDVVDAFSGSGDLMGGVLGADKGRAVGGLATLAGGLASMGLPGSYGHYKGMTDTVAPHVLDFLADKSGAVKGPRLTLRQAADLGSNSKKRRKWPEDRRREYDDNSAEVSRVRKSREASNPLRFDNRDPLSTPMQWRLKQHQLATAKRAAGEQYGVNPDDIDAFDVDAVDANARAVASSSERVRRYNTMAETPLWNKKFSDDVRLSARIDYDVGGAVNRANMEAVPRALKKQGWTVRHASKDRGGKSSSRYVVSPDGAFEVRLSDHELPDTPQRQYSREQFGGPTWNDEVVLRGDESPEDVINEILSRHRDSVE